jgi:hypothetical protein
MSEQPPPGIPPKPDLPAPPAVPPKPDLPAQAIPPEPELPAAPRTQPPTPDVAPAAAEASMPGAHRGGFERFPTAPVGTAAAERPEFVPTGADDGAWPDAVEAAPRGLAGTALSFAIAGLLVSFVVGWGFPVGIAAIVIAVVALRRPVESRAVAGWALALGILSVLYSAGWLMWAASRAGLG